ncbi:MAG: glycosyltransferase [Myxococcaceae bacterium]|nr:glycosyltransferase [Myxococcaceae bacterium]
MSRKPCVLVVVSGFPPAQNYGGPAVSLDNLCRALRPAIDCAVVTSDHDLKSPERLSGIHEGWNDRDGLRVRYLPEREIDLFGLRRVVDEVAPDVLYVNSLFAAKFTVPLLKISRERALPLLLAPRGELCAGAFDKKYKKLPYLFALRPFLRARTTFFHATSDHEAERVERLVRPRDGHIFQMTETPTLPPRHLARVPKRPGVLSLVFLSRIHHKKNLLFALDALAPLTCPTTLDIYGPIEEPAYWERCQSAIARLPPHIRAHYRGTVARDAIHATFARYDAFLFPTCSENYGHVIPEALLSGCPAILSDQTPWNDLNDADAGWALPLDRPQTFTEALTTLAAMDAKTHSALVERVRRYLDAKLRLAEIVQSYVDCFHALASRRDSR